MDRTFYYTLRVVSEKNGKIVQEIYDIEFDTYEEAYDCMCMLYINAKNKGLPCKLWGIYKTTVTKINGETNEIVLPALTR